MSAAEPPPPSGRAASGTDLSAPGRRQPVAGDPPALSQQAVLLFWIPLAAQWFMMALEGPFLAAIIARMGDPTFNLAAYGVAFAFAILVESPVIMLMSASTALVEDRASFLRLRNFANTLNAGTTALLLFVLLPPVNTFLMTTLLGLPPEVAALVYGALWLLLPWPAAIGYRRFLHGVLIRSGRTRLVAGGTLLRLAAMAGTAGALYAWATLPGAWVGALALSAGVCVEAIAAHFMAAGAIRELRHGADRPDSVAREPDVDMLPATARSATAADATTRAAAVAHAPPARARATGSAARAAVSGARASRADAYAPADVSAATPVLTYREIIRFYYPLALTSLIALTTQPILTFFMGRSTLPVASLAVFPVVHALTFLFRAPGFSFQETVVALAGRNFEQVRALARFGAALAVGASGALALVVFTPLSDVWFLRVSGLPPDLAALATTAARFAAPMPALAVLLAFQQAILVKGRSTRPITAVSALEVASIAALFAAFGWGLGMTGVHAAVLALVIARGLANVFLAGVTRRVLRLGRK